MAKFDIEKYKQVDEKQIDYKQTKDNLEIFLNAYFKARERVGQPREPKTTATLSIVPTTSGRISREAEDILIYNEQAKKRIFRTKRLIHQRLFSYSNRIFRGANAKKKKDIY